jgi:hypothetical protein
LAPGIGYLIDHPVTEMAAG